MARHEHEVTSIALALLEVSSLFHTYYSIWQRIPGKVSGRGAAIELDIDTKLESSRIDGLVVALPLYPNARQRRRSSGRAHVELGIFKKRPFAHEFCLWRIG